jgi:MinD-like ATPase involved in chromosome partitioning or flagellar assembly
MKTINVYLDTKDSDYNIALSKSLLQHSKYFAIQAGSPQQEHREWDLYLTDDMNASAIRAVYLTEDPSLATINEETSCYILHKYQHIGHISNTLRLAHSDYSKSEMLSDEIEHANIICVCSSSGGTGCTSVALGLCQELTRFHGKKVLYISMEEFESTATHFPDSYHENNNITKFVYSILNVNASCNATPTGYMLKDEYGVFAFHPARGRNPLRDLNGNEFVKFINHITKEKLFTDLVLDCGNGLDDSIVSTFSLSAVIFHVTGKNLDRNRRTTYLRTVANRLAIKNTSGIKDVLNFYVEKEVEDGAPLIEETIEELIIEDDSASLDFVNGRSVISLDKMFGQGIRDLAQHVILTNE